jgi:hypothetical protein
MQTLTLIITAIALMLATASGPNPLVGRWETKPSPKGNVTGLNMKADSSFEGFINRKPFVTGTYTYKDSLLSFVDNGCSKTRGLYKVIWFSEGDSIRFEPISDTCTERRNGMSKTIMGRIK